jgi:hypothetical protein
MKLNNFSLPTLLLVLLFIIIISCVFMRFSHFFRNIGFEPYKTGKKKQ